MNERYDHCFVCGKSNPIGWKLEFSYDSEGRAYTVVEISENYAGYPGVVHGGVISTLLDEVMAKAVMHSGKIAYTAKLQLRYRMPLPVNEEVQAEGWIEEAKSRSLKTKALLYGSEGLYAEAEAIFMVPPNA